MYEWAQRYYITFFYLFYSSIKVHCEKGCSYAKILRYTVFVEMKMIYYVIALFVIAIDQNIEMANCKEHGIGYEHSDYR